MAMVKTLGKSVGGRLFSRSGLGIGAAIGVGAAISSRNPLQNATNASLGFVFGDENADNMIMGRDIGFGELFGIPKLSDFVPSPPWHYPDYLSPAAYARGIKMAIDNPTVAGDAFMDYKDTDYYARQAAVRHNEQGYTDEPYINSIYPYRSVQRRGVAASGDMVFGMYNTRM